MWGLEVSNNLRLKAHEGLIHHPSWDLLTFYRRIKDLNRVSQVALLSRQKIQESCWFHPWVGKIPLSKIWKPTSVFSPGKSHGQRSLAGYSPWGCRVRHDGAKQLSTKDLN